MTNPQSFITWMIIVSSLAYGHATCHAAEPEGEYLSDRLVDHIVSTMQGWGELGFNSAVRPAGRPAMPLRIKDRKYLHGRGPHAPGEIVVNIGGGQFDMFKTDIRV